MKKFKEDKKGILDVCVRTKNNEHIDIEIQVLPTPFMAERSLFYWSKMYKGQVAPGETYGKLEKCIAINIVDFEQIPLEKIHTSFHVLEDETGYKLTDVLEIHFLELPKLAGPLYSIYSNGNCDYVFKGKHEAFKEIKNNESFLSWCLYIVEDYKTRINIINAVNMDEKEDKQVLLEQAKIMERLSYIAVDIQKRRN